MKGFIPVEIAALAEASLREALSVLDDYADWSDGDPYEGDRAALKALQKAIAEA